MKKINESAAMREIHDIRRGIFEETKNMSSAERIEYMKKKADDFEKESGIKLRKLAKAGKQAG